MDYLNKSKEELINELHKLQKENNFFYILIDHIPNQIFWKDTNLVYQGCNKTFANIIGLPDPKMVVGKTDFDFSRNPIYANEYRAIDRQVIDSGNAILDFEEKFYDSLGNKGTILTSKIPIIDNNNKTLGILGITVDITELKLAKHLLQEKNNEIKVQNETYRKFNLELSNLNQELTLAKEKAEESDRLKTAFLQNMSHEIRTPMNAIMGFADLLKVQFNNKATLEKFSDIIIQRCKDLLDIINDILDISKIESGQLAVRNEECDLQELFGELSTFFSEYQNRIGKQHIHFNLQSFCVPGDNLIITDKVKLKQIFINLISNAFKFTEQGTIQGGCKIEKNNQLLFYIKDTGIGIPVDKQKTIFERFSQLNDGYKKNIGGTGLGLPIVKGLIKLLDGDLFLESEPGKGSIFSFKIPYVTSKPLQPNLADHSIDEQYYFSNHTILIVEDDRYNVEYLKEILTDAGLKIIHAENGKEAIEISISQPIDLILMDIRLPDIDGYEATQQIRQHKPHLKIIAQTAYASHEEKQKALDAGCNDYLSKPTKQDVLLFMLNKYLS